MKRFTIQWSVLLLILTLLLAGCASLAADIEEDPTEEPEVEITEVQEEETEEPTKTPEPTETEEPTPTRTPRSTNTPRPTATEEPTVDPQPTRAATTASTTAATAAATQAATSAPTQGGSGEVVPPGTSIWVLDTAASETGSSDKCPAPFLADFYGLVRIETRDDAITWMRAQDGITYTLLRQSPNVYWGTGASIYPGYTLTISVVFASPTGLGVTFVLIDQAIEGCNHYWKYGGTLR